MTPTYSTSRFRALKHDFAIRTTSPELGKHLDKLLAQLSVAGEAEQTYELVDLGSDGPNRYTLSYGDRDLVATPDPSLTGDHLFRHVNTEAVRSCGDHVVLHAAAAEHQGAAVVIPGASGAGKSTLVAGLVRRGLRYLTDEAVAIDTVSGLVQPFPKPIAIETGSQSALADLRPHVGPAIDAYLSSRWLVEPTSVRADAVAPASPVRCVVAVRYEAGGPTALSPLRPATALLALARNCVSLSTQRLGALQALATVVRGSACYSLAMGDLGQACDLMLQALATGRVERP